MKYLLISTHDQSGLHEQTLRTVTATLELTSSYDVLLMRSNAMDIVPQACTLPGCDTVHDWVDEVFAHPMAETCVPALKNFVASYDTVVFANNTTTKNMLPRLAALLDISPITDICAVVDAKTFKRPIYAGNAIAKVFTSQSRNLISVRTASFSKCNMGEDKAKVNPVTISIQKTLDSRFIRIEGQESDKPDLTSSKIVVSGGRGLGSKESFDALERLAKRLGAAVGASRAAVDAGFVPNDYQVGQTGKIIAPEVYIAIGISGAVQHLAGMKDSRVIIAINNDPDAPIFQVADYGVVGDWQEVIPQLEAMLGRG